MGHVNVIIATPGHHMDMHYVHSLTRTIKRLNKLGISWRWISDYTSHVSVAREYTFDQIGDDTYDKIFWIDSDISWDVDDFLELYYSEEDIISGVYLTSHYMVAAHKSDMNAVNKKEILLSESPIEIAHCGFGFLCIKYGINEKISRPLFREMELKNIHIHAEDTSWCLRAKSHGHKIYLHPKVRVRHHKTMPLELRG